MRVWSRERCLHFIGLSGLLLSPLQSCKTTQGSDPRVIGGREDLENKLLPKTVGVDVGGGLCTGVFISDNVLMTAGHCVVEGIRGFTVVSKIEPFASERPFSSQIVRHPSFPPGGLNYGSYFADVALAIFPNGTAPKEMIAKLATTPPRAGDHVRFAGYGQYTYKPGGNTDEGIRRYGENKVAWVDEGANGIFKIEGIPFADGRPGEDFDAATAPGDSGAPLYNDAEEIIGTVSTGAINQNRRKETFFANMTAPATRSFIDKIVKENDGHAEDSSEDPAGPPN